MRTFNSRLCFVSSNEQTFLNSHLQEFEIAERLWNISGQFGRSLKCKDSFGVVWKFEFVLVASLTNNISLLAHI